MTQTVNIKVKQFRRRKNLDTEKSILIELFELFGFILLPFDMAALLSTFNLSLFRSNKQIMSSSGHMAG